MKPLLLMLACCLSVVADAAELRDAREQMKAQQPAKAAETIQGLLAQQPDDPWLRYNAGVAAYAANDFKRADELWQELAAQPLPNRLRDQVWFQIGNVAFRTGEHVESAAPTEALAAWQQSREAYRVALATRQKDAATKNNLHVVEQRLAKLHALLARRLVEEAKQEGAREPAMQKLEAALDHQRSAQALAPRDESIQSETKQTERLLAQKYAEQAAEAEQRADNTLKNPSAPSWDQERAAQHLKEALADFSQAKSLDAENQPAADGEPRVQEKLAQLRARQGDKLRQEARNEAAYAPDQAIAKYEEALEKFDESLGLKAVQPKTQQAQSETKQELEQLLEKRGDQLASEGRQDLQNAPAEAAEELLAAADHYEQTLALNPDNATVPPKLNTLAKELPELLNSLAKQEQQRADQVEAKSTEQAVNHLEKAATSYAMAQQVAPDNQPAQQGQEEVQAKLAKLRTRLAQPAKPPSPPGQPDKPEQPGPGFQQLLSQVKSDERQKQYEQNRRGPTDKYDPAEKRIFKFW